jgi:hypothetical protein
VVRRAEGHAFLARRETRGGTIIGSMRRPLRRLLARQCSQGDRRLRIVESRRSGRGGRDPFARRPVARLDRARPARAGQRARLRIASIRQSLPCRPLSSDSAATTVSLALLQPQRAALCDRAAGPTDGEPELGTLCGIYWRSCRSGSRYDACGDVRPITWPSGSLKSPITIPTPGTSSGPIILVPPRLSAFSSAAPTSATWT